MIKIKWFRRNVNMSKAEIQSYKNLLKIIKLKSERPTWFEHWFRKPTRVLKLEYIGLKVFLAYFLNKGYVIV